MAEDTAAIISIRSLVGYAFGFRTPSIIVECRFEVAAAKGSTAVFTALENVISRAGDLASSPRIENKKYSLLADQIVFWSNILQQFAKLPMVTKGKWIENNASGQKLVRIMIPAPVGVHEAIAKFIRWYMRLQAVESHQKLAEIVELELPKLLTALHRHAPTGSNIPYFLAAASELNIPVTEVIGRTLQFGQGKKARWLDSSFTDKTPHIGALIARNKSWASQVLHDAGFPVPPHSLVNSREQAVKVADKLGYPVVIKPADLDGGIAVSAGLQTAEEVSQAFDNAKKHSKNVMLEKHVPGRDYRLTVFNGELLWAIERVPAGVTGDGKNSVSQLLDILNRDPRRGDGIHASLKKIKLDTEALSILDANGKSKEYVPAQDEFVPLSRRANVSAGGVPISVMGRVHPDNERLVVRATKLFELDISGVDLLISDISKSWLEVGASICEINGQPQLGSVTSAHVYKEVLSSLIDGDGRVPITVIFDPQGEDELANEVSKYSDKGFCVGYSGKQGVFVGEECISNPLSPYRAGQILLRDRRVEAIVIEISDDSLLKTGLPFDCINTLIYAGNHLTSKDFNLYRLKGGRIDKRLALIIQNLS